MAVDDAHDPLLHRGSAEIEKEPYFQTQQAQVCEYLLLVNGQDFFDRLDLYYDSTVNEKVDAKA